MGTLMTDWLWSNAGVSALVLARVAGLSWTAPALATPGFDARLRIALAALLTVLLAPQVGPSIAAAMAPGTGWPALLRAMLTEALIGAALGWSAALIVAGARQAGEVVGAQAGLSAAALFDPEAGGEMTPLGHLYGLIALATFLALDGPLTLVRALVESYRVVPAGGETLALSAETAALVFGHVGQALALALRAAAPVALALALAGVALGLLGRAAPSLPLAALSLPVRSAIGLVLVALGLVTLAATVSAAWSGWPGPGGG
jgi:flagellar biosynthetic protein FliR